MDSLLIVCCELRKLCLEDIVSNFLLVLCECRRISCSSSSNHTHHSVIARQMVVAAYNQGRAFSLTTSGAAILARLRYHVSMVFLKSYYPAIRVPDVDRQCSIGRAAFVNDACLSKPSRIFVYTSTRCLITQTAMAHRTVSIDANLIRSPVLFVQGQHTTHMHAVHNTQHTE